MSDLRNIVKHALHPRYAPVMVRKAFGRLRSDGGDRAAGTAWARPLATPIARWCETRDAALWAEARDAGQELRERARALGRELGVEIGGGARVELLYFLVRHVRPRTVVETGVLHGYSSCAILTALDRNGDGGRLWSSDFPYFREADPERLIGVLVPDELRAGWTLLLDGDRENLPRILAETGPVDFFHYDSDKSYAGRRLALDLVEPHLAPGAPVVMDDIQDNLFFRDWSQAHAQAHSEATQHQGPTPVHVLGSGYYVGVAAIP